MLVPQSGVEAARDVLLQADLAPRERPFAPGPRPLVLVATIVGGGAAAALVAWLLQGGG